jgi:hypothetical protein
MVALYNMDDRRSEGPLRRQTVPIAATVSTMKGCVPCVVPLPQQVSHTAWSKGRQAAIWNVATMAHVLVSESGEKAKIGRYPDR